MSLIRRAKTDPHSFAKLYEEHVQAVYRYESESSHYERLVKNAKMPACELKKDISRLDCFWPY